VEPWRTLIDAYDKEDRLLRELVADFPPEWRDRPGPEGIPGCRAALAHLAFWNGFTVDFFRRRLDPASLSAAPPLDFEDTERAALAGWADLPFGEILARYLEAAANLREFLADSWSRLTSRERHEFRIPLRHNRDHRLALARALAGFRKEQELDTMAHGA